MQYVVMFVFWTQCTIGMFVASRKPVWALVALIAWVVPFIVMGATGQEPQAMTGPTGFVAAVGVWVVFSIWFLTSRRIGTTAWRVRQETVTAGSESAIAATTPVEAMHRWLLSSGTPFTLGLQWGLAMLVLLGVQLVVPRLIGGDKSTRLGDCNVVRHAFSGRRGDWCRVLDDCNAIPLVMAPCREDATGAIQALRTPNAEGAPGRRPADGCPVPGPVVRPRSATILATGLSGTCHGRPRTCSGLVRTDASASQDFTGRRGGTSADYCGCFAGLIHPLFRGETEPEWGIVLAVLALVVLLREVAYARWREADWPRTQSSMSS